MKRQAISVSVYLTNKLLVISDTKIQVQGDNLCRLLHVLIYPKSEADFSVKLLMLSCDHIFHWNNQLKCSISDFTDRN